MSLAERDYMRERPYLGGPRNGRRDVRRWLLWGVAVFGLSAVLAGSWFIGLKSQRYGGCWYEMGGYVHDGVVVGCVQESSGIVVGVRDSRWSAMNRGEKLLLVAAVDSFMRSGRGGSKVELRGDPSGMKYWVQSYGKRISSKRAGWAGLGWAGRGVGCFL